MKWEMGWGGGAGKGGMRFDGVANKLVFRNVNFFCMLHLRNVGRIIHFQIMCKHQKRLKSGLGVQKG